MELAELVLHQQLLVVPRAGGQLEDHEDYVTRVVIGLLRMYFDESRVKERAARVEAETKALL